MVNGPSVVALFLVFTVLVNDSLARRFPPSLFRSLRSKVEFVNGECRFGISSTDRGYVTLKDGRCFEASCSPGSKKLRLRLEELCPPYHDSDKYCWLQEDVFVGECCRQPELCY
uniref:8.9 kDa family member n=1 Tax=Rhipicephalus appendiculatus TaxID=34631 RepID=A0A131Z5V3_RHIAP